MFIMFVNLKGRSMLISLVEYLCQLKMFIMFVNLTTLDADITGGVCFWWSMFLRGLFRKDVCPLQDDFLAARRDFALPGHLVTPPQLTNSLL
jgi:hypothetical protein